ncbi:MAG: LysR family transcriptional regulator [Gammaproteobacteria bacterium]|nr:LysR family transcriptional regulator [Gammaproteobacteria bacterium]
MSRFENMETFVKVVDAGTISAAADKLNVAKSAVSRHLKELEAHLGVELFHRTTRKLNLTETGSAYYKQCVRILDDIVETELATSQAHGTLKGGLKVALPSSFGLMHIGPAINEFIQIHPQVEFDLDFNDREVDLIQEGFDLAIRIANLPDSSLIARRIAPIHRVICASPEYLERNGTPQLPDDLAEHQCLVYTLQRDFESWLLTDAQGKSVKVKLNPYIKASAGEFLRDAAVLGQGITFLPSFIVYKEIESGTLLSLFTDFSFPAIDAYVIYPQTRHLSQRVRTMVDFLVRKFEGIPYWDIALQVM